MRSLCHADSLRKFFKQGPCLSLIVVHPLCRCLQCVRHNSRWRRGHRHVSDLERRWHLQSVVHAVPRDQQTCLPICWSACAVRLLVRLFACLNVFACVVQARPTACHSTSLRKARRPRTPSSASKASALLSANLFCFCCVVHSAVLIQCVQCAAGPQFTYAQLHLVSADQSVYP